MDTQPSHPQPARTEPGTGHATLDVERAFLGALLCVHDHESAAALLDGIGANEVTGGATAATLELVRAVVFTDRQPPAPVLVYARAEQRLAPHQLDGYGEWLFDTYAGAPPPATAWHVRVLLFEHAWRRALHTYAEALLAAAGHVDAGELADLDAHARAPVEAAHARYVAVCDATRSRHLEAA